MAEPLSRPAFNVCEPFQGVVLVQMNSQFALLLQDFIDDMNQDVHVEKEIWALRRALADPAGSRDARDAKRHRQRRNKGPHEEIE
jgi:hypothetical protein